MLAGRLIPTPSPFTVEAAGHRENFPSCYYNMFDKYSPGVLGAFSSLNSFTYCGAGVKGSCAAGMPSTIRNGVESVKITGKTNQVRYFLTAFTHFIIPSKLSRKSAAFLPMTSVR